MLRGSRFSSVPRDTARVHTAGLPPTTVRVPPDPAAAAHTRATNPSSASEIRTTRPPSPKSR